MDCTWKGQCEEAHGGTKAWGLWYVGGGWEMEVEKQTGLTRGQDALVGRPRYFDLAVPGWWEATGSHCRLLYGRGVI